MTLLSECIILFKKHNFFYRYRYSKFILSKQLIWAAVFTESAKGRVVRIFLASRNYECPVWATEVRTLKHRKCGRTCITECYWNRSRRLSFLLYLLYHVQVEVCGQWSVRFFTSPVSELRRAVLPAAPCARLILLSLVRSQHHFLEFGESISYFTYTATLCYKQHVRTRGAVLRIFVWVGQSKGQANFG